MTRNRPLKNTPALVLAAAALCALHCSDRGPGAPIIPSGELAFEDRFDRDALGPDWSGGGGSYRIVDKKLVAQGARNNPLWLKTKLPRNAKVEFKASSQSEAVDIKAELWGDGRSVPASMSYKATSYVVILGGWNNSRSIIARMDEHKDDRKVRKEPKAVPKREYLFTIVRQGRLLSWFLDRELFLQMDDPSPLQGPGHEHFAFNNWQSKVSFDDLAVYKL